ncbi:hypothetical protein HY3_04985 [Hyphomonas pacifica]|uniref:Uncharacterized protein n=1 Tax=Hyphomonas pacifica TaxID=1280941 RepID=A0A8B2PK13_9PROT|nr:hypothetical protein HY3_04985 [Hyphomonas pacifica]RAN34894.1 hypothetical protein HY11_02550 [Hyphomonas pacifica]
MTNRVHPLRKNGLPLAVQAQKLIVLLVNGWDVFKDEIKAYPALRTA